MKTTKSASVGLCGVLLALAATSRPAVADILATSNFNIPPFTAGIPVEGQGGSEPGWAAPWRKLGGFNDRGHVVTSPTQEGNGAVQIFADEVFGTSVEREWFVIAPVVRVDAFVYVTPGAEMDGQIVTATPASGEIDPRRAGSWRIEASGLIGVFDTTVNGYVSTGFHTLPNQWNKYSLIADTTTNTYSFLFNDQLFNSPHPLPFMNPMFYVDGINLRAARVLTSYADNVTVTAIPEPSTLVLGALGMLIACSVRRRAQGISTGDFSEALQSLLGEEANRLSGRRESNCGGTRTSSSVLCRIRLARLLLSRWDYSASLGSPWWRPI